MSHYLLNSVVIVLSHLQISTETSHIWLHHLQAYNRTAQQSRMICRQQIWIHMCRPCKSGCVQIISMHGCSYITNWREDSHSQGLTALWADDELLCWHWLDFYWHYCLMHLFGDFISCFETSWLRSLDFYCDWKLSLMHQLIIISDLKS